MQYLHQEILARDAGACAPDKATWRFILHQNKVYYKTLLCGEDTNSY